MGILKLMLFRNRQQLQQTVRRRNQRPIEQTYEWPS